MSVLVGKIAPDFTAPAVMPNGEIIEAFKIDRGDGVVQHQVVNNLPLGRNVTEMLRMVDALQFCIH